MCTDQISAEQTKSDAALSQALELARSQLHWDPVTEGFIVRCTTEQEGYVVQISLHKD